MSKSVRPVPEGHPTVSPYLIVNDGAAALDFYKKAFGATELMRHTDPNGKVGHAEITIGDSVIMLADEFPDFGARSPRAIGGSPVGIHLYVEGVDALASRAIAAGAKVVRPVQDQFYGDRNGTFEDPFGHIWHISTHIEDVPPEELSRRVAALKAHQHWPAARRLKRVQMRGVARRLHARRTLCTLSVQTRATTKQFGPSSAAWKT